MRTKITIIKHLICSALRTPVTRARRGGLKDVHAEMMLATVLKGVLSKTGIDPKLIEDIVVGNVLPPGGGATLARMASLYAGIPETSSVMTVNRQCSSGLQAVAQIASAIKSGYIEIGIGNTKNYNYEHILIFLSLIFIKVLVLKA